MPVGPRRPCRVSVARYLEHDPKHRMTSSGTTVLIFALGVWLAPPPADIRATGITKSSETPVEAACQRR
jgi:hypothetical protein